MASPDAPVAVAHVERTSDPSVLRWVTSPVNRPTLPGCPSAASGLGRLMAAGVLRSVTVDRGEGGRVVVDVAFADTKAAVRGVAAVDRAVRDDVLTDGWCTPAARVAGPLAASCPTATSDVGCATASSDVGCPTGCRGCPAWGPLAAPAAGPPTSTPHLRGTSLRAWHPLVRHPHV
jgi:hypothetical protein